MELAVPYQPYDWSVSQLHSYNTGVAVRWCVHAESDVLDDEYLSTAPLCLYKPWSIECTTKYHVFKRLAELQQAFDTDRQTYNKTIRSRLEDIEVQKSYLLPPLTFVVTSETVDSDISGARLTFSRFSDAKAESVYYHLKSVLAKMWESR